MKIISHRGNLNGKSLYENHPEYIQETLAQNFDVEIDVWWVDDEFWLGHDNPQYDIGVDFLRQDGLWCHAKDIKTFYKLIEIGAHCFSHDQDEVALTTKGYLWSTYGNQMTDKSICVMPPRNIELPQGIAGVCSDNVGYYNENL